jgi:riboflavin kinase/FMN adenylyltransferase
MDYRDFIKEYLIDGLDMHTLVLGYDCHFGRNREGGPESVQAEGRRRGFDVRIVPPLQIEGQIASSTFIRNTLTSGDLASANRLLGHPYSIAGEVERGAGKGREIGFPTANLRIDHPRKLWPPNGAYAVRVKIDGEVHNGMMNVGKAPTMKSAGRTVEVNVFDFDREIYGKRVIVYCIEHLRKEVKFPSAGDLVEQLESDRRKARAILSKSGETA